MDTPSANEEQPLYPINLEVEMAPPTFSSSGREACLDSMITPLGLTFDKSQRNGVGSCPIAFIYSGYTFTEPKSIERQKLESEILEKLAALRGACSATLRFI